jgi:hypothetical protein
MDEACADGHFASQYPNPNNRTGTIASADNQLAYLTLSA